MPESDDWENTIPPEGQEAFAEWKKRKEELWLQRQREQEEEQCPHDEHDHGICLDCGKDIWEDIVGAAEMRRDCQR